MQKGKPNTTLIHLGSGELKVSSTGPICLFSHGENRRLHASLLMLRVDDLILEVGNSSRFHTRFPIGARL